MSYELTDEDYDNDYAPLRGLVETGGNPFIKLEILADDSVQVTAVGVEQQNVLPMLALIVKHAARVDPVPA